MSAAIERFHQRRRALQQAAAAPKLVLLPSARAARLRAGQTAGDDTGGTEDDAVAPQIMVRSADPAAARATLADLGAAWDRQRSEQALNEMWEYVLRSFAGAFGLGHLLAAFDRQGGAVDTTHNVRQGIYATDAERRRYDERLPTPSAKVYQHQAYVDAGTALKQQVVAGSAIDTYTGLPIRHAHLHDRQLGPSTDHAVSCARIDKSPARVLAGLSTEETANLPENLVTTTRSVNSFLKDRDANASAAKLQGQAATRGARLRELEARRDQWTDQERKQYNRLHNQEHVDPEVLKTKEAAAQAAIDKRIDEAYYKEGGKFWRATARAGLGQGVALGAQQALGVLLIEFFAAALDEVRSLRRDRVTNKALPGQLRVRLRRVWDRVIAHRKAALAALGEGVVSGVLASLVTTLINAFITTARRTVRLLREGALSLVRAIKLLALRPAEMTPQQALHEASKVLASAGLLAGGIALEEAVAAQLALVPALGAFAGVLAAAIVGALTALVTSVAVVLLDRADLFRVVAEARSTAVAAELDARVVSATATARDSLTQLALTAQAL